ncbi:hypothetical protein GYMLUDRAFT_914932 [Collybiopsis luxurians FD-317 M1]|nr:hypothetical protein GYMLUDRAFT_914932 [Collybiopsis luxurians FD-317 M1]
MPLPSSILTSFYSSFYCFLSSSVYRIMYLHRYILHAPFHSHKIMYRMLNLPSYLTFHHLPASRPHLLQH